MSGSVSAARRDLASAQQAFTEALRAPEDQWRPPDGVRPERMALYRRLFFNNVLGLLGNGFPVLRKTLGEAAWRELVRGFFRDHQCRTPLFLELGLEFLEYLERERRPMPEDPPFLWELAHYERLELDLGIAEEEIPEQGIDPEGDPMGAPPALSPLVRVAGYRFPVHRIGPEFRPLEPPEAPTVLAVYRDRGDKVGFLELNPATARMLQLIEGDPDLTGAEQIRRLAVEIGHSDPDLMLEAGRDILNRLRARDLILGVCRNGSTEP